MEAESEWWVKMWWVMMSCSNMQPHLHNTTKLRYSKEEYAVHVYIKTHTVCLGSFQCMPILSLIDVLGILHCN